MCLYNDSTGLQLSWPQAWAVVNSENADAFPSRRLLIHSELLSPIRADLFLWLGGGLFIWVGGSRIHPSPTRVMDWNFSATATTSSISVGTFRAESDPPGVIPREC